jgi:hypothetical protein
MNRSRLAGMLLVLTHFARSVDGHSQASLRNFHSNNEVQKSCF